jgi:hypothetical protein
MQFPDSLLSGTINLTIRGNGSYTTEPANFMQIGSRSERCVRNFFDARKLMTVGEFCECLNNNLQVGHPAMPFRTPTHQWCVFVKTSKYEGVNICEEYRVLRKESLLLEIHPYILNNYMLIVSMTPEYERAREKIVPGDATPEYLLESAKTSSDCKMHQSYQTALENMQFARIYDAKVRGGRAAKNDSIDQYNGDLLKRNIAYFEEDKLMAIRVRNDIAYTASLRSYHLLE